MGANQNLTFVGLALPYSDGVTESEEEKEMKLAVFLHGTTIMHRSAVGCSREECVRQVQQGEASVRDFASYVPIGEAANKLHTWSKQGAEIIYLSSHKRPENVELDRAVLTAYHFPVGQVLFRDPAQTYQDLVGNILPDLLIEDDCESIGGEQEMISPHLKPDIQAKIISLVVKEFEGIDHLPNDLTVLKSLRR